MCSPSLPQKQTQSTDKYFSADPESLPGKLGIETSRTAFDIQKMEKAREELIREQQRSGVSPLQIMGSGFQLIKGQAPISILTGGQVSDGTLDSPEAQRALAIQKNLEQ